MTDHRLPQLITPDWPAPASVKSIITTRVGGVSLPPFESFNTAIHVGDSRHHVDHNRRTLSREIGLPIYFLDQVHGDDIHILNASAISVSNECPVKADAVYSSDVNQVCAIQTADCLPVFICNKAGTKVGLVHAGWRSLAMGLITKTITLFNEPPGDLLVYLGPAISSAHFEVGSDVVAAFTLLAKKQSWGEPVDFAVSPIDDNKYYVNLYALAKHECVNAGVNEPDIYGGDYCTFSDASRFYSYRREGRCGRMASLIWLAG